MSFSSVEKTFVFSDGPSMSSLDITDMPLAPSKGIDTSVSLTTDMAEHSIIFLPSNLEQKISRFFYTHKKDLGCYFRFERPPKITI